MRSFRAGAAVLAALLALPAGAEIYRWTDDAGREHFTQDLSQVPAGKRPAARQRAAEKGPAPPLNTYDATTAHPPARRSPREPSEGRRVYRVRVEQAGTAMLVGARVNRSVVVPFVVDTGASDVSIPRWAAEKLGLRESGRTREYLTANGVVEEPVVMLRSVELGGARVDDVPASISSSMEVGLLGLSFFNHFQVHVDPAAGVLTLVPNDLAERGGIRGGRSPAQWRAEFAGLRRRLERLDAQQRDANPNASSKLDRLEAERAELLEQLEILEAEADQARVPLAWRE